MARKGFGKDRKPPRQVAPPGITTPEEEPTRRKECSPIESKLLLLAQASPKRESVYRGLVLINRERGDHSAAKDWAMQWIMYPSESRELLAKQLRYAKELKAREAYKSLLQQAIRLAPSDNRPRWFYTKECIKAGDWDEGLKSLEALEANGFKNDLWTAAYVVCTYGDTETPERASLYRLLAVAKTHIYKDETVRKIVHSRILWTEGRVEESVELIRELKIHGCGIGLGRLALPVLSAMGKSAKGFRIAEDLLERGFQGRDLKRYRLIHQLNRGDWRKLTELYELTNKSASKRKVDQSNIYSNLSIGETLFFLRWIAFPETAKRKPTIYVKQPVVELARESLKGKASVKPLANIMKHTRLNHTAIESLPGSISSWEEDLLIFNTQLKTKPELVALWKERIAGHGKKFTVGINWRGSAMQTVSKDLNTNIPLASFRVFAEECDWNLVSLQRGMGSEELKSCNFIDAFHPDTFEFQEETRLEHIAAIIENCDLVVCDDSGPSHLACNLGVRTVINLRSRGNWFWEDANIHHGFYSTAIANYYDSNWDKTLGNGYKLAKQLMSINTQKESNLKKTV